MDRINRIIPWHKQLLHQYKSLRWIPLRRKWFVGYDLQGNTYWEFRLSSSLPIRRAVEYRTKRQYLGEYTDCEVPPRWMQWLRQTRSTIPTLQELVLEEQRVERMKVLGEKANERWNKESTRVIDGEIRDRVREVRGFIEKNESKSTSPGHLSHDSRFNNDQTPIESSTVRPRR